MRNLPKVSAYCATYGRVHLLEEVIYSFLNQDYKGQKELIILNDFPKQTLFLDNPEVKIYNLKEKINPLGKKFNETVKLCTGEILFPWEDDDVYLPNKISLSVEKMLSKKNKIFHTKKAFYEVSKGKIVNAFDYFKTDLLYHVNMAIHKDVFYSLNGYEENDRIDLDLSSMSKFFNSQQYKSENIDNKEIFYIYRLDSTKSYHGTWLSHSIDGMSKGAEDYIKKIEEKIPLGDYYLNPHWECDYKNICESIK